MPSPTRSGRDGWNGQIGCLVWTADMWVTTVAMSTIITRVTRPSITSMLRLSAHCATRIERRCVVANETAITWTDLTWNPVHGCSKISPGCAHCYAAELSLRRGQTKKPWTPTNAAENVTVKPHKLREPLSKAKEWQGLGAAAAAAGKTDGKLVFVNSMSDLFHEEVSDEFIAQVFSVMRRASQHTFQVLTKRPERMRDFVRRLAWVNPSEPYLYPVGEDAHAEPFGPPVVLPNVWLGVSIENRKWVGRADVLRATPAAVRFISAEPLLGPLVRNVLTDAELDQSLDVLPLEEIPMARVGESHDAWVARLRAELAPNLDLTGIDWLIVGGESGPKHRPMRAEWVRDLRDAALHTRCSGICWGCGADLGDCRCGCSHEGTAFFFKQWGGARPGGEALLDGRAWREFPKAGSK